ILFRAHPCAPRWCLIPCRMRAMGPPRSKPRQGFVAVFRRRILFGVLGCGGSTPMDMWITKDPDAGANFDAPVRDVPSSQTDAGNAGAGGGACGGAGGAAGAGGACDTGAGGAAGGTTGNGGG